MSTFTHAGVSTLEGQTKVRFANGAERVKVLVKNGHTGIDIIELKHPMTKDEAVAYLLSIDFDNGNATVRAALEAYGQKEVKEPKAANKQQRGNKEAKKPKKDSKEKKVSVASIRAKGPAKVVTSKEAEQLKAIAEALDDEDQPF